MALVPARAGDRPSGVVRLGAMRSPPSPRWTGRPSSDLVDFMIASQDPLERRRHPVLRPRGRGEVRPQELHGPAVRLHVAAALPGDLRAGRNWAPSTNRPSSSGTTGRRSSCSPVEAGRRPTWTGSGGSPTSSPTDRAGTSRWLGEGQFLSYRVCQAIRETLAGDEAEPYWSRRAAARIGELRERVPVGPPGLDGPGPAPGRRGPLVDVRRRRGEHDPGPAAQAVRRGEGGQRVRSRSRATRPSTRCESTSRFAVRPRDLGRARPEGHREPQVLGGPASGSCGAGLPGPFQRRGGDLPCPGGTPASGLLQLSDVVRASSPPQSPWPSAVDPAHCSSPRVTGPTSWPPAISCSTSESRRWRRAGRTGGCSSWFA